MEMSGQLHAPAVLTPGTHWIGGWVDPTDGLDAEEKRKNLLLPKSNPGHPTRIPSLYRLSYPVKASLIKLRNLLYIYFKLLKHLQ
jgi:hypothetical protein